MPTYEYACAACGHKFEEFQSIKAEPIKKCPQCKKNKVQRLISAGAGFIFKGSGFYETDYRSEAYKTAAKSDGSTAGSATPAATAGSSTEATTKPATAAAKETPAPKAKTEPTSGGGATGKKTNAA